MFCYNVNALWEYIPKSMLNPFIAHVKQFLVEKTNTNLFYFGCLLLYLFVECRSDSLMLLCPTHSLTLLYLFYLRLLKITQIATLNTVPQIIFEALGYLSSKIFGKR